MTLDGARQKLDLLVTAQRLIAAGAVTENLIRADSLTVVVHKGAIRTTEDVNARALNELARIALPELPDLESRCFISHIDIIRGCGENCKNYNSLEIKHLAKTTVSP